MINDLRIFVNTKAPVFETHRLLCLCSCFVFANVSDMSRESVDGVHEFVNTHNPLSTYNLQST